MADISVSFKKYVCKVKLIDEFSNRKTDEKN